LLSFKNGLIYGFPCRYSGTQISVGAGPRACPVYQCRKIKKEIPPSNRATTGGCPYGFRIGHNLNDSMNMIRDSHADTWERKKTGIPPCVNLIFGNMVQN